MVDAASVAAAVREAGAAFGPPAPEPFALRWGALFEELDGRGDEEYAVAVELIYEGYLFHYRTSRVCADGADECRENALLAGDFLYARGLRLVSARGDAAAVGVLARLMAACSYLRSVRASFAADDALWAFAVGGLAALRRGSTAAAVDGLFERFDAAVAGGAPVAVRELALAEVPRLTLADAGPLLRALESLPGVAGAPAAVAVSEAAEAPAGVPAMPAAGSASSGAGRAG